MLCQNDRMQVTMYSSQFVMVLPTSVDNDLCCGGQLLESPALWWTITSVPVIYVSLRFFLLPVSVKVCCLFIDITKTQICFIRKVYF